MATITATGRRGSIAGGQGQVPQGLAATEAKFVSVKTNGNPFSNMIRYQKKNAAVAQAALVCFIFYVIKFCFNLTKNVLGRGLR